jgi:Transposase zinc-binding domain
VKGRGAAWRRRSEVNGSAWKCRTRASTPTQSLTAVMPPGVPPGGHGGGWAELPEVAVRRRVTTLEIRGTADDLLHRTVARGTAELRAACAAAERTLPWFVWRELERYGACGDPEEGFAWLHCPQDDHHRLVPFSCKGRAFCPACIGRRMAEMSLGCRTASGC